MTGYPRVELVPLLATNLRRARAFVARQLGPLASPDEPAERLRETVLRRERHPRREGALRPPDTVVYRVERAEELLGRRVTESPIELTCALTLAAALGPAVLSD